MSDELGEADADSFRFLAGVCDCGHATYPPHPICPACGDDQERRIDLSNSVGEVITWTRATTTPPGVREPNTLAIAEFEIEIDGGVDASTGVGDVTPDSVACETVRALAGTTDSVSIGDRVRPVPVEKLRDPAQAIRETNSQRWDGVRFEPLEE